MKGIVFNLLERVVVDEHGEDVWDDLIDAAGVTGAYTSLGSYPDAELMALVTAAADALALAADDVVRWFGRQTLPLLFCNFQRRWVLATLRRLCILVSTSVRLSHLVLISE